MLKKRGDVTPYIVIGLIIILFLGIVIYVISSQRSSQSEHELGRVIHLKTSALNIKPYVEDCLREKAFEGILNSAYSGEKTRYHNRDTSKVAIEEYVKKNLAECVDFNLFNEFEIIPGEINPEVNFREKQTVVGLKWPLTIRQDDLSIELSDFRITFPLALDEIFDKIESIEKSGQSLDLNTMFDQSVDIILEGCRENNGVTNLVYVIEDNEYLVDDKLVSFFFDVPIKNLTNLFRFEDKKLFYDVPVEDGIQILRRQNDDNRFVFEVNEGIVSGCGSDKLLNKGYTFSLVEENNVVASVSINSNSKNEKNDKINIDKKQDNNPLNYSFVFSSQSYSPKTLSNLTLVFYSRELIDLMKNDVLVDFDNKGDYIVAKEQSIQSNDTYELVQTECKKFSYSKDNDKFVSLVSLNYDKELFFEHSKSIVSKLDKENQFESTQFQFVYNHNTCDSLSEECKLVANDIADVCAKEREESKGKVIGLVYNPLLGVEHNNSLVSSYLSNEESSNFCVSCNVAEEINMS